MHSESLSGVAKEGVKVRLAGRGNSIILPQPSARINARQRM